MLFVTVKTEQLGMMVSLTIKIMQHPFDGKKHVDKI